jgi:hypothetical protein
MAHMEIRLDLGASNSALARISEGDEKTANTPPVDI